MLSALRPAIVSTVLFTGLLGVAYPMGITAAARIIAPNQAAGSLVTNKAGHVIGSTSGLPRSLEGCPRWVSGAYPTLT